MNDGDTAYMRRALRLAARGAGRTSPDPLVGMVLVSGGDVIGAHRRAPATHAEVDALRKAGQRARGATLYTNLEPCAPSCAAAIAEARVGHVVIAMRDPDARHSGRGVRALRAAGVEVHEGTLKEEAERLNAGVVSRLTRGRPSVALVVAATLDGRALRRSAATAKAVTRELVKIRDRADAVMVGVSSIVESDPALTVGAGHEPLRVIVDADARTPAPSKVVRHADPQRTVIFVGRDADVRRTNRLREAGVLLVTAARAPDGLDVAAVLRWLGGHGVNTVVAEADPGLAASLVRADLVDRVIWFVSPLAGGAALPVLDGVPDAVGLRNLRARRVGGELVLEGALG